MIQCASKTANPSPGPIDMCSSALESLLKYISCIISSIKPKVARGHTTQTLTITSSYLNCAGVVRPQAMASDAFSSMFEFASDKKLSPGRTSSNELPNIVQEAGPKKDEVGGVALAAREILRVRGVRVCAESRRCNI